MSPLDPQLVHDVVQLDKSGMKWRAIARALHISRNTVRRIVTEHREGREQPHSALPAPSGVVGPSKLDPFRAEIDRLLLTYPDIKIIGEKQIRIVHNLIALPGTSISEIRRIYSHPQGLKQCARYLETLTEAEKVPYYDTAGSVAFIAREGKREWAAVAGEEAAEAYGMEILKSGIETNAGNYTRFFIVARREHPDPERPNKASIVFSTPDKPGALFRCMKTLSERGLNMKKLESRPILGKPWQYMFYVDVELSEQAAEFQAAFEEIKRDAEDVRLLGMYRV